MHPIDWTTVVSVLGAAVVVPVASVVSALVGTRGRRADQRRLGASARAEIDARMLDSFVSLMGKANARGAGFVAESVLSEAIKSGLAAPKTPEELGAFVSAVSLNFPVGMGEQEAAIAAVAELGLQYPLLFEAAKAGLESVASFLPSARLALDRLGHGPVSRQANRDAATPPW